VLIPWLLFATSEVRNSVDATDLDLRTFDPNWLGNGPCALYQGTTLVVPLPVKMVRALAPATAKSIRDPKGRRRRG
jgi:hypothetical protein